jgi:hypothetical protein
VRAILAVLITLMAIGVASGCNAAISAEDAEKLQNIKTPVWEIPDLETEKIGDKDVYVYTNTIQVTEKTPYYRGSTIEFDVGYPPGYTPGSTYSSEKPLFHRYEDFSTFFIYEGLFLKGAQTYNKEGLLVAEVSEIRYYVADGQTQGIEITELHYGEDEELIFTCKSEIEFGTKVSQSDEVGVKERDYYFTWPESL